MLQRKFHALFLAFAFLLSGDSFCDVESQVIDEQLGEDEQRYKSAKEELNEKFQPEERKPQLKNHIPPKKALKEFRGLKEKIHDKEKITANDEHNNETDIQSKMFESWNRLERNGVDTLQELDTANSPKAGYEDQVMLHNGELIVREEDFSFPERSGIGITFERIHRSHVLYNGPLGRGWSHNHNQRLIVNADKVKDASRIKWLTGKRRITFHRQGDNWQACPGAFYELHVESDKISIFDPKQRRFSFEQAAQQPSQQQLWRIKQIATRHDDWEANQIRYKYIPNKDVLRTIIGPYGNRMKLSYSGRGRLKAVSAGNILIRYNYRDGCLSQVEKRKVAVGFHTISPKNTYDYDNGGGKKWMTEITSSGIKERVIYEQNPEKPNFGRVLSQQVTARQASQSDRTAEWSFKHVLNARTNEHRVEVSGGDFPEAVDIYYFANTGDGNLAARFPSRREKPNLSAKWQYEHNPDGLLKEKIGPLGKRTEWNYDEKNGQRRLQGNLLSKTHVAREKENEIGLKEHGTDYDYLDDIALVSEKISWQTALDGNRSEIRFQEHIYSAGDSTLRKKTIGKRTSSFIRNRYGSVVAEIGGEGAITLKRYYKNFNSGDSSVAYGGLLAEKVEDVSPNKAKEELTKAGIEFPDQVPSRDVTGSPVAKRTHYEYDRHGNTTLRKTPGFSIHSIYNKVGDLLFRYDTRSDLVANSYNKHLRKISSHQRIAVPEGTYEGEDHSELNGKFYVEKFKYDTFGHLAEWVKTLEKISVGSDQDIEKAQQPSVKYDRFPSGRLKSRTYPNGLRIEWNYKTDKGLLKKQQLVSPDGKSLVIKEGMKYDKTEFLLSYTDGMGSTYTFRPDAFGRSFYSCGPDEVEHRNYKDGLDRTIHKKASVTRDGSTEVISESKFTFNESDRLEIKKVRRLGTRKEKDETVQVDEWLTARKLVYDAAGRLMEEHSFQAGSVTQYRYDGLGRKIVEIEPEDEIITRLYNEKGKIGLRTKHVRNQDSGDRLAKSQVRMYDDKLRPRLSCPVGTDDKAALGRAVLTYYDSLGQKIKTIHPSQFNVHYTYDSRGLELKRIKQTMKPIASELGEQKRIIQKDYTLNGDIRRKSVHNTPVGIIYQKEEKRLNLDYFFIDWMQENWPENLGISCNKKLDFEEIDVPQTTKYKRDGFGRLIHIEYPDGRVEKRNYGPGSMLREVEWTKGGSYKGDPYIDYAVGVIDRAIEQDKLDEVRNKWWKELSTRARKYTKTHDRVESGRYYFWGLIKMKNRGEDIGRFTKSFRKRVYKRHYASGFVQVRQLCKDDRHYRAAALLKRLYGYKAFYSSDFESKERSFERLKRYRNEVYRATGIFCPLSQNEGGMSRHLTFDYTPSKRLSAVYAGKDEGAPIQRVFYDHYGNVSKVKDRGNPSLVVTTNRSCDSLGQILSEQTKVSEDGTPVGQPQLVTYKYDLQKGSRNVELENINKNQKPFLWKAKSTQRDLSGRVESVTLDGKTQYTTYKYAGSRVIRKQIPASGVVKKTELNSLLEPTEIDFKDKYNDSELCTHKYLIDKNGSVAAKSFKLPRRDVTRSTFYQYDNYGRLVAEGSQSIFTPQEKLKKQRSKCLEDPAYPGFWRMKHYRYDPAGNRTRAFKRFKNSDDNKGGSLGGKLRANTTRYFSPSPAIRINPFSTKRRNHDTGLWRDRYEWEEWKVNEDWDWETALQKKKNLKSMSEISGLASNRLGAVATKNHLQKEFRYDMMGRLRHLRNVVDGTIYEWNIVYDALGRVIRMRGTPADKSEPPVKLTFATDAFNRRIIKKVERPKNTLIHRTTYKGQKPVYAQQTPSVKERWQMEAQYLWGPREREILTAILPRRDVEDGQTPGMKHYFPHQDRMLNVFMCTGVRNGRVNVYDVASFLGFGENDTHANVEDINSTADPQSDHNVRNTIDKQLSSDCTWIVKEGKGYVTLRLDKSARMQQLILWTNNFPDTFDVYVLPDNKKFLPAPDNITEWEKKAEDEQWLVNDIEDKRYTNGSIKHKKLDDHRDPYKIGLSGKQGRYVVIVWPERSRLSVREFEIKVSPRNPTSFAFGGNRLDEETGLYYHGSRYRLPSMGGKFISPDPLGYVAGENLYAYAYNNPLKYHDPQGDFAHVFMGAGLGGAFGAGSYALQLYATDEEFSWAKLGMYTGAGAASGALAAGTWGATAALSAKHSFSAGTTVVLAGSSSGAAGGTSHGVISKGGATYLETGDVRQSLSAGVKSGLVQGGIGVLGGAAGGAILSRTGAGFWGAVGSGTGGGATAGGVGGGVAGFMKRGTLKGTLAGAGKGAVVGGALGGAISAGGWGIGRATGMIRRYPIEEHPEGLPDPRGEGVMVRTNPGKRTYGGVEVKPGYARHHKKPLSLGGRDASDNIEMVPQSSHRQPHPPQSVTEAPYGTLFY